MAHDKSYGASLPIMDHTAYLLPDTSKILTLTPARRRVLDLPTLNG